MNRKQPEHDICEKIEQLIGFKDEMLKNKTKFYCEHTLKFGKEYVDKLTDGLYDECENYLKNSSNEELEKQFIKCCETVLALKGKEICEEVDPFTNNEFLIKKGKFYCENIFRLKDVDKKLVDKCKDYLEELYNFYYYQNIFDKNNMRKEILCDAREGE